MTSVVTNNADVGREAEFDVLLPVDAFITNLTMKIDDQTIVGNVEEKRKAKRIYDKVRNSLNFCKLVNFIFCICYLANCIFFKCCKFEKGCCFAGIILLFTRAISI